MTRYINTADTAKLIRTQLKAKFPGVKFSVKSHVYSGGSSIRVEWIDGPTAKLVDAVAHPFQGGGFDGMIDMAYSVTSYLLPDGSAAFAQTTGTESSGGLVPSGKQFMPVAGAERVHFGVSHIFTHRNASARLVDSARAAFARKYGEARLAEIGHDWQAERDFYEIINRRMIAA